MLANGYKINQSDKYVYRKFSNRKCVIIYLYVDDMIIFGTDLEQVEITKRFLSYNFVMKDMGVADIILEIRILKDNDSLILKKFNYLDYAPTSTPFDLNHKLIQILINLLHN